ncbi:DUF4062 domain-containing protein [Amycolatopsis sp. NPDC004378]
MPDLPRYQVFISSTYTDLIEERQALISTLLQLRALPAGMELFPAADDEAWELIKRVIDESDYYLLVIGGRYGSTDSDGVSYTEKEYDYATAQGKPVMAFLHKSPADLPMRNSEGDPEARELLQKFRKKVEVAKHVKFWSNAEELSGKVALSYTSFTSRYPAVGWVRGGAGDSAETLAKLAAAQDKIAALESEIKHDAFQPPVGAAGLADEDEYIELTLPARMRIRNLAGNSGLSDYQKIVGSGSMTWNEILFGLGPLMLDEAMQSQLQVRFNQEVSRLNKEDVLEQAIMWAEEKIPKSKLRKVEGVTSIFPDVEIDEVKASPSDFETALLQLQALGLVERGTRKRTASDRGIYWTLTPWGRTRLTRLRAVRKGETKPPEAEVEDASSADSQD